jgi:hypothetical protein
VGPQTAMRRGIMDVAINAIIAILATTIAI